MAAVSKSPRFVYLGIASLHKDLSYKNPLRLPPCSYLVYLLILKRKQHPLLSPLRLPVPPSRLGWEVLGNKA
jgi:hypothetical protein